MACVLVLNHVLTDTLCRVLSFIHIFTWRCGLLPFRQFTNKKTKSLQLNSPAISLVFYRQSENDKHHPDSPTVWKCLAIHSPLIHQQRHHQAKHKKYHQSLHPALGSNYKRRISCTCVKIFLPAWRKRKQRRFFILRRVGRPHSDRADQLQQSQEIIPTYASLAWTPSAKLSSNMYSVPWSVSWRLVGGVSTYASLFTLAARVRLEFARTREPKEPTTRPALLIVYRLFSRHLYIKKTAEEGNVPHKRFMFPQNIYCSSKLIDDWRTYARYMMDNHN